MPIEAISAASLDYLAAFDLKCIAISPTGRVFTTKDPAGASAAWWIASADADRIVAVAAGGDVPAAAAKLGLVATPHCIVARRVAERVSVLDQDIAAAIDAAILQEFNIAYRRLRLGAKKRGASFMTYSEALRRLRAVLARSVARQEIPASFIASVFGEPAPSKRKRRRGKKT